MKFDIRKFGEEDRETVMAIGSAIYPEYQGDCWHAASQFDSERVTPYRYVAVADEILGYGAIRYLRQGHGRIDLIVSPRWQRHGVGSRLMERLLEDLASEDGVAAHGRVREDHEEGLSFLRKHGFVEHQRMYGLELNIADAQPADFRPLVVRLEEQGVKIETFAEEREHDPLWISKLLDLHNAVLPTWPDPEGVSPTQLTQDEFLPKLEQEVAGRPDALFIAKVGDLYVGYSGMFALGTAVRPEFRGRGIATALKIPTIEYAQKLQMKLALTCTANPAMLAINEKLGYKCRHVEIRMTRSLLSE
jgi:GNAT superfamily N-acetyltransferase